MVATAKLFMHGRSQAVRLPKEFRFSGKEVRVRRIGKHIVLEPLTSADEATPWDAIDAIGDNPFMPEGREQPAMPADRPMFDK